jgi:hypothetical protein
MSAVNEWIVREYLEALGFPGAPAAEIPGRGALEGLHEEVDLLATNPALKAGGAFAEGQAVGRGGNWRRCQRRRGGARLAFGKVHGGHAGEFAGDLSLRGAGIRAGAEAEWARANPAKILCMATCRWIRTSAPKRWVS